ncbi:NIPSNAP family protein [Mariluticola halotolerans]|uniref:NIPSNAP family protein n=1 Tax=Mariluticola halotolerans TaxID=2909283 RepID=UPI0026E3CED8|nr:NIPSNAP family protein [Mariluticola halotolerans]UJQ94120.1 NIPSNAP family protein [Mariluticola halotolerans]
MLYELRAYDLAAGQALRYLELFSTDGVEYVSRHLPMAGYWLTDTGALNRIYHLWIYKDLAERAQCRAGLAADRDWNERFVPKGFPLIIKQRNYFMTCIRSTDAIESVIATRSGQIFNQTADAAVFTDTYLALSFSEMHNTALQNELGAWTIVSGERPGRVVSLWRPANVPDTSETEGLESHELLRALSCSPIR